MSGEGRLREPTLTDGEIEALAEAFRVLGHVTRLRLMDMLMQHEELSVGELESLTATVQPALSQQLGILRKAGFVTARRAAKQVYYRIAGSALADAARVVTQMSGENILPAAPVPSPSHASARGSAASFAKIL